MIDNLKWQDCWSISLKNKTEILKLQFVSVDAEFLKIHYVLALISINSNI